MGKRTITHLKDEVIFHSTEHGSNYNSFPNAVILPDGKILVTFRQARDMRSIYGETRHLDSHSRAMLVTSTDGGQTWDETPRVLYDHFIYGVQDPCLNLLRDGTILATFFMWKVLDRETAEPIGPRDIIYYNTWVGRPAGLFTSRSVDGGATWDEPLPVGEEKVALRGKGVELADGSILLPAYKYLPGCKVHVMKTTDRGATWEHISTIEHHYGVDETSLFLTPSGKIVAFCRADNFVLSDPTSAPLLTFESVDGGVTWSEGTTRRFYSPSPFEPIRLQSGKVLVSYGHRFPPYGIRCFLLDSECSDWENAEDIVLRTDCEDEDIGYTSAVQLENGEIKIFYYYMDSATGGYRYIAATTCIESE